MITLEILQRVKEMVYTTGCLLYYVHSKEHYKLIPTDLSKQQKLGADAKSIQQINIIGSLKKNTSLFFHY